MQSPLWRHNIVTSLPDCAEHLVLGTTVVASVVDRVGESALELLGDDLLDTLGNDRCVTTILSVSLAASARAGVVNLTM